MHRNMIIRIYFNYRPNYTFLFSLSVLSSIPYVMKYLTPVTSMLFVSLYDKNTHIVKRKFTWNNMQAYKV